MNSKLQKIWVKMFTQITSKLKLKVNITFDHCSIEFRVWFNLTKKRHFFYTNSKCKIVELFKLLTKI